MFLIRENVSQSWGSGNMPYAERGSLTWILKDVAAWQVLHGVREIAQTEM